MVLLGRSGVIALGLFVLGAALAACPALENPYLPYPDLSLSDYSGDIQPIVDRSCSSLGCHGDHNRRLTFYSVDFLRADPLAVGDPLDPDALTPREELWNYEGLRTRLVDETDAATSLLVLKCIDPELGGIPHGDGIIVWDDLGDPDYEAFVGWIEEGL